MPFLILFFLLSFIEVYLFAVFGAKIGVLNTLVLCFVTAILGGFLVRLQGLATLMKAQTNLRHGKMPINELFDGFCIIIAGFTLITPGFMTDIVGFLLLVPPFRLVLKSFLLKKTKFKEFSTQNAPSNENNSVEGVIEGEYENVSNPKPPLNKD